MRTVQEILTRLDAADLKRGVQRTWEWRAEDGTASTTATLQVADDDDETLLDLDLIAREHRDDGVDHTVLAALTVVVAEDGRLGQVVAINPVASDEPGAIRTVVETVAEAIAPMSWRDDE